MEELKRTINGETMEERTLPKLLMSRKEAEKKIQERIKEGQKLQEREIPTHNDLDDADADSQNWSEYNEKLLSRLFDNSLMLEEYKEPYKDGSSWNSYDLSFQISEHINFINAKIKRLKGISKQLDLFDEVLDSTPQNLENDTDSEGSVGIFGNQIFIVHGRDNEAKNAVTVLVRDLGFKEIILDKQPNSSLTIIEKLEQHARNVGFAIVLLTPDDVGALKEEADNQLKLRARQNVILELGYFMGKLGRKRVCLLIKGELENPSDLNGILYAQWDESHSWRYDLAREMKKIGLPVDMNKI